MGLNRFYTYNGQILKTADGAPIGYEKPAWDIDGLVARWAFEDNLIDYTGTYNGTAVGALTYGTGKIGKCMVTTTSIYASTGITSAFFNANSYSLCVWVKSSSSTNSKGIFTENNDMGFGPLTFYAGKVYASGPAGMNQLGSTASYTNGAWHFIVTTWDRPAKKLTLNINNGAEAKTVTLTNAYNSGSAAHVWGRYGASGAHAASFDNSHIYNRVITDAEIAGLWNGGAGI